MSHQGLLGTATVSDWSMNTVVVIDMIAVQHISQNVCVYVTFDYVGSNKIRTITLRSRLVSAQVSATRLALLNL